MEAAMGDEAAIIARLFEARYLGKLVGVLDDAGLLSFEALKDVTVEDIEQANEEELRPWEKKVVRGIVRDVKRMATQDTSTKRLSLASRARRSLARERREKPPQEFTAEVEATETVTEADATDTQAEDSWQAKLYSFGRYLWGSTQQEDEDATAEQNSPSDATSRRSISRKPRVIESGSHVRYVGRTLTRVHEQDLGVVTEKEGSVCTVEFGKPKASFEVDTSDLRLSRRRPMQRLRESLPRMQSSSQSKSSSSELETGDFVRYHGSHYRVQDRELGMVTRKDGSVCKVMFGRGKDRQYLDVDVDDLRIPKSFLYLRVASQRKTAAKMTDKVYEVMDRVREEMNKAYVKTKDSDAVSKALEKLEAVQEMGSAATAKAYDAIDQLKSAVAKALGPEMAEKLGISELKETADEEE
ncbi:Hypothetical Protein FCC1311_109942 [Hondaea fermentalgiana]|uniref:Uncharacterized protein n=1 Tax=Hondaea fermentalgiana TaxID=2315210 RepID=A0A2R5GV91_9STRA|nr:Hypothetical Protein FCC1311_109942 [Hondaea fermentalgiana]|eukprot:GBG34772.1 Hypothetical Protein FCC1311_109942 [Hondaea fermentalgiana]